MKNRIKRLLKLAVAANQTQGAFYLLPDIIDTLEQVKKCIDDKTLDSDKADSIAGGLGRLITDSYEFSESSLGTMLLRFTSDLRRMN